MDFDRERGVARRGKTQICRRFFNFTFVFISSAREQRARPYKKVPKLGTFGQFKTAKKELNTVKNKKNRDTRRSAAPKKPNKTRTKAEKPAARAKKGNEGKVYYGKTRYIDRDTKPRRRFVVVIDHGENVSVSKLTSIKQVDETGKNIKETVVEIKPAYKGLKQRTGVFNRVYNRNRVSKEKLKLGKGNGVFDEKPEFEIDDEDFKKVDEHIKKAKRDRKKKGKR